MPKLLPEKVFLKSFSYAPRLAVSLVIKNKKGEILLARRSRWPQIGAWHMPGGFVLKGEPLLDCIARVAKKELAVNVNPKSAKLLGLFDNLHDDQRGHVVDAIYTLVVTAMPRVTKETQKETAEVKFFAKLPRSIGFGHGGKLKSLGYK